MSVGEVGVAGPNNSGNHLLATRGTEVALAGVGSNQEEAQPPHQHQPPHQLPSCCLHQLPSHSHNHSPDRSSAPTGVVAAGIWAATGAATTVVSGVVVAVVAEVTTTTRTTNLL